MSFVSRPLNPLDPDGADFPSRRFRLVICAPETITRSLTDGSRLWISAHEHLGTEHHQGRSRTASPTATNPPTSRRCRRSPRVAIPNELKTGRPELALSRHYRFGLLFDAQFDSSVTMFANRPKVENLATTEALLIAD
jgi:hypothetical protein